MKFIKKHTKIIGLLFAVIITVVIFVFRNEVVQFSGYGYFGLFILSVIGSATIFLPTPLIFTAFVAGAIFNPLAVAIISSVGSSLGEITGYLAGYGAEDIINKDLKFQRARKWTDKYGLWVLFVLALIPNPLFDLAGILAGATKVPVHKFLFVVWLGKLIKFGVLAYLGANSINLIDRYI